MLLMPNIAYFNENKYLFYDYVYYKKLFYNDNNLFILVIVIF